MELQSSLPDIGKGSGGGYRSPIGIYRNMVFRIVVVMVVRRCVSSVLSRLASAADWRRMACGQTMHVAL